jgi:hypothetical protein
MYCSVSLMKIERSQAGPVPLDNPLNELLRSKPSDVMSLYSTSAKNFGSTQVAFGFLIVLVSFDFGLTTVSSCFLIWLETVRDRSPYSIKKAPAQDRGQVWGRKLELQTERENFR